MKNILTILTLTICFFLPDKKAKASHLTGGEITYTCTATAGTYTVALTLYRDCSGIPLGNCSSTSCSLACGYTLTVTGADASCNGTSYGTFAVNLINVTDANPNPLCPNSKSICRNLGCVTPGTFTPGIEKYTFQGTVNLNSLSIPASCCNVMISFSECCRNGAIATGASNANFYVETTLNRCITPCNSAPICSNDPFVIICGYQPYIYNNGAIDPDLDSLSYSFTPALAGAGSSVPYTTPYSYSSPMPFTGGNANLPFPNGIHCDSLNGDVSFTPPYTGSGYFVGVVTIKILQWKKISGIPTIVGKTMRDVQMWLQQCAANSTPTLITYPSNGNQPIMNWMAIAGQQLCFDVVARDSNLIDTTYLTNNSGAAILGSTFLPNYILANRKISGPRQDSCKFCWTPDTTKINSVPYYFSVIGRDNKCPVGARTTRAFAITVVHNYNVNISQNRNGCYRVQLSYSQSGTPQTFNSTLWKISKIPNNYSMTNVDSFLNVSSTPFINFSAAGKYLVKLNLTSTAGLNKIFYDTIQMDTPVTISVNDTTICKGSNATYNFLAHGGRAPYSYRWFNAPDTFVNPLNSPFFTSTNFTLSPSATSKYYLQARDLNGCRAYDSSITIKVNSLPVSTLAPSTRICNGSSYTLDPGNNSGNAKKYLWNTGDSTRTLTKSDTGNYTVTITDTLGCKINSSIYLYVNPAVAANAGNDTTICGNNIIQLHASGGQNYQWKNLTSGSVISPKSPTSDISIMVSNSTSFETIVYENINGLECSKADSINVTVNPKPVTPAITGLATVPRGQTNNFSVTNNSGSSYNWFVTNGNINSGNGTNQVSVVFTTAGVNGVLKVLENAATNCKSDTATKTISVTIGVGINNQSSFENFNIFPNPTTGILNIELITDEKQIQIEVTDVLGKVVKTNSFHHTSGIFKTEMNLNSLNKGIYFVTVKAGDKSAVSRITVE